MKHFDEKNYYKFEHYYNLIFYNLIFKDWREIFLIAI